VTRGAVLIVRLALIPATWALAFALIRPVADRTSGMWPLPFLLALGCAGSAAAVVLA
jgi:hypothetical protein